MLWLAAAMTAVPVPAGAAALSDALGTDGVRVSFTLD